ncbi:MAG: hypothetical protein QOI95_306 [Acidimicrobiaceae bacterium]|jgi:hypothetical protein
MASTQRSLVLGFTARLEPSVIEPFVNSLRSTGYQGKLGLILAQYDDPIAVDAFRRMADVIVQVDDDYRQPAAAPLWLLGMARRTRGVRRLYPALFSTIVRIGREIDSSDRWRSYEFHLEGLQSLRYAHYYDFVRDHAPEADYVFLSDLRDVVFQDDPFREPVTHLECFLEDPLSTVGRDVFNGRWVRDLYGDEGLRTLHDEIVSCSGTVVGTRPAILHYLKEMAQAITWRRRPMGSHDQGVHNWLLRSGRLGATIVANEHGRVLTMGAMTRYRLDDDERILNEDGAVVPVIHQFDRHPVLVDAVSRRIAAIGR